MEVQVDREIGWVNRKVGSMDRAIGRVNRQMGMDMAVLVGKVAEVLLLRMILLGTTH
jgi:hypothetical protein